MTFRVGLLEGGLCGLGGGAYQHGKLRGEKKGEKPKRE